MTAKDTLKQWFSNLKKPTQNHFWAWLDSFWHKSEKIPMENIDGLDDALQDTASNTQLQAHLTDNQAHKELFDIVKVQIDQIKAILNSDDTELDQLQEIVNYIKQNKQVLSALAISNIAGLVDALAGKSNVNHVHSYSELTDKPIIPETYNVDACSVYDYSKITDLEYNKNLSTGKYISTDNGRRFILFIHNYPDGEGVEIPVVQVQIMFYHSPTVMPNLRWIIKQTNGSYAFSNGGSWFQFASTHYVSSRAFVHHRINPTSEQLNETVGNGIFTIREMPIPNLPDANPKNGLIINFKGDNQLTQVFYDYTGDVWVRNYLYGNWLEWKNQANFKNLGINPTDAQVRSFKQAGFWTRNTYENNALGYGDKVVGLNFPTNRSVYQFAITDIREDSGEIDIEYRNLKFANSPIFKKTLFNNRIELYSHNVLKPMGIVENPRNLETIVYTGTSKLSVDLYGIRRFTKIGQFSLIIENDNVEVEFLKNDSDTVVGEALTHNCVAGTLFNIVIAKNKAFIKKYA